MDELLPCPFCGSEVSIVKVTERPNRFLEEAYIQCEGCGFSVHHKWLSTETLIEHWNTRAERTCHTEEAYGTIGNGCILDEYKLPRCSECHYPTRFEEYGFNYCPNCGAKVVE